MQQCCYILSQTDSHRPRAWKNSGPYLIRQLPAIPGNGWSASGIVQWNSWRWGCWPAIEWSSRWCALSRKFDGHWTPPGSAWQDYQWRRFSRIWTHWLMYAGTISPPAWRPYCHGCTFLGSDPSMRTQRRRSPNRSWSGPIPDRTSHTSRPCTWRRFLPHHFRCIYILHPTSADSWKRKPATDLVSCAQCSLHINKAIPLVGA